MVEQVENPISELKPTWQEQISGIAERWGLSGVLAEAERTWELTEQGDQGTYLSRMRALPLAALVNLESSVIRAIAQGEQPEDWLDTSFRDVAKWIFPNPIGTNTLIGGVVGFGLAVIGIQSAEREGRHSGALNQYAWTVGAALTGASLANRYLEK